jgi:hypothetical protein
MPSLMAGAGATAPTCAQQAHAHAQGCSAVKHVTNTAKHWHKNQRPPPPPNPTPTVLDHGRKNGLQCMAYIQHCARKDTTPAARPGVRDHANNCQRMRLPL